MRIAHITATFPPYYGGTGKVSYCNVLELAQRGHAVKVLTAAYPPGQYAYPAAMQVQRLPVAFRVGNAPLLPDLTRLNGYDIVHLHFPFYFGAELVTLAARLRHLPLVITYHQDVLLNGPLKHYAHWHAHTLGAWVLRSAARVLFTTLDYAQASQARWLLTERPQAVGELPNGVDVQRFRPSLPRRIMRERFGFAPTDIVLLLVAGLDTAHYFKGVEVLLRALAQVPAEHVKLLIVGDGDLRRGYEHQATALGLAERVTFAGRVSDAELPLCYVAANIGVLPSWTMGEAFGMVLLEAMACGKPVIASNLPGVRAVVRDGETGLLCQPGDAADLAAKITALVDAPDHRLAMGANGRTHVETHYAWPKIGAQLEKIYTAVLAENR